MILFWRAQHKSGSMDTLISRPSEHICSWVSRLHIPLDLYFFIHFWMYESDSKSRAVFCHWFCSSTNSALQPLLRWCAAEFEVAGIAFKSAAIVLNQKRMDCRIWLRKVLLPKVEELNYLGVLLLRQGKMEWDTDRKIGATSAVVWMLNKSISVNTKFKQKADLSVYHWVYIPTLIYSHVFLNSDRKYKFTNSSAWN